MIDATSIAQLKNTVDIADIINNYIELKKSGANYKACCPFHGEKTASLVVSPSKQIYHCFGCGAGGDVFNFVQAFKKIEFYDAVEEVAQMYNFTLSYTTNHTKRDISILERYNYLFISSLAASDKVKDYVLKRNIKPETIEEWQIGYALPTAKQKQQAAEYLFATDELIEANLFARDGDRVYARFSDRLTFPIHSSSGKIIGWSGRAMSEKDGVAKYLNSPQSDIFDKAKILYGLDKAKANITKLREAIIVEGHIDVVLSHQAGFKNTVGTQGTALTMQHIEQLKKLGCNIKLVFDGDKAGQAAALKASTLIVAAGLSGEVIIMPAGLDPADMISSHSVDKYEHLLCTGGIDCIRYVLLDIVNRYNLDEPYQKSKALQDAIKFLNSTRDKIVANEYKTYLAMLLGVDPKYIDIDNNNIEAETTTQTQKISLEQSLLYTMIYSDEKEELRNIARQITHLGAWSDEAAFKELVSPNPNISKLRHISILDAIELNKSEFMGGAKTLQRRYLVSLKSRYINDLDVIVDINTKLANL
ncbi:MAG: DNA primase [Sulfurovaceae bacterium]|nr:DNA primase [Sulfurovaceae bacterium]MDD5549274.1 DNA primase [Sulfurovaceae bacterium]